MKPKLLTLFSLPRTLYERSGTHMGILYTEDFHRMDWGQVEDLLETGVHVHIRPPNEDEAKWADNAMKRYTHDK